MAVHCGTILDHMMWRQPMQHYFTDDFHTLSLIIMTVIDITMIHYFSSVKKERQLPRIMRYLAMLLKLMSSEQSTALTICQQRIQLQSQYLQDPLSP